MQRLGCGIAMQPSSPEQLAPAALLTQHSSSKVRILFPAPHWGVMPAGKFMLIFSMCFPTHREVKSRISVQHHIEIMGILK